MAVCLLMPSAAGEGVDAGAIAVSYAASPTQGCDAAIAGDLCLLAWDDAGTLEPGDDTLNYYRGVDEVRLTVRPPVGGTGSHAVPIEPSALAVEHPVFVVANQTWLQANESRPEPVRPYVSLESRPWANDASRWGVFMEVYLPPDATPIGDPADYFEIGFCYSVCNVYRNNLFDSTESRFQLLPYNVRLWSGDSDSYWHSSIDGALPCHPFLDTGETCAAKAVLSSELHQAFSASETITPNLIGGFSFNRTVLEVEPPRPAAPAEASGVSAVVRDDVGPAGTVLRPADNDRLASATHNAGPGAPSSIPVAPPVWAGAADTSPSRASWLEPVQTDMLLVAATAALLVLFAALYARITRERALRHAMRRRVYEAIVAEPGLRIGTLSRRLGVDYKTIAWHVRMLQTCGLVRPVGDGQRRLFINDPSLGTELQARAIAASSPVAQAVLAYLHPRGTVDFRALCADLSLPRSSASGAITRLARAGLVTKRRSVRVLWVSLASAPAPPARLPSPTPEPA